MVLPRHTEMVMRAKVRSVQDVATVVGRHGSRSHEFQDMRLLRARLTALMGNPYLRSETQHGTCGVGPLEITATHSQEDHEIELITHCITFLQAGTGTWDGPAPRGARHAGGVAAAAAATKPAVIQEPRHVRLSNGSVMPIIGMGTAAIKSAEAVRWEEGGSQAHTTAFLIFLPIPP